MNNNYSSNALNCGVCCVYSYPVQDAFKNRLPQRKNKLSEKTPGRASKSNFSLWFFVYCHINSSHTGVSPPSHAESSKKAICGDCNMIL